MDLGHLLHSRKSALDLTWYDIGRRGGFGSHTIAYELAKKKDHLQLPREDTRRRLALALETTEREILEACVESIWETFERRQSLRTLPGRPKRQRHNEGAP